MGWMNAGLFTLIFAPPVMISRRKQGILVIVWTEWIR